MASVKVAVRVRPFNNRERDMKAQLIIEMDGKRTRITNSKAATAKMDGEAMREKYKDFTFDYSYWSYDSNDDHFASQEQVFKDLGMDVVGNAFQGYNACVFAYGQTGSGKTHTMMGSPTPPEAQGLIPRICKDMFNRMNEGKEKGTTYRTEVSYLEIYNERVKDLLKRNQTHSLKVREHPKQGPYVEELSKHLVMDYDDIQGLMNRGNANRTTACTNMNDVSSRSHAIFTMTFVQASFVGDMPSETVSKIHLVDLAGSERADATGATGQRLKEGAHINKSLVTLGSVISALAEASQTQSHKKVFIPYRDSVLTWLLKDSLGGNAKTIMIATLSPADCNFGETLSTLRYANRAKNIVNKPTINEDPNVKLIRDLRAEISKLRSLLKDDLDLPSSDVLEELHKKEAKEKSLTEEWTEKWKETQKILLEQKDLALRKAGQGVVLDSQMPHLIGIDDDLLSTGITLYHLKEGETKIGSDEAGDQHDITLKGQGVESKHCSIMLEGGVATLVPNNGSVCWVNGQQIDRPTRLFQGCVILLGRTNMFRYNDPAEAEKLRREGSHSHVNLSRLSFLSRSASDLAWCDSPLNTSATGEESTVLEEKRKQLEAEEARLQKESEELMSQKKQLEEQKIIYEQLQAEKEEAWKAEQLSKSAAIHSAQKELEERRLKLEHEYAAHRRRLAEDWKRLEQQEQETLASLQSKEKDLKKRRDLLEWEVDQEMNQIETEAQKIETLRTSLESKQQEVALLENRLSNDLASKLNQSESEIKQLLAVDDAKFQEYIDEQSRKITQWKSITHNALLKQKTNIHDKLAELSEQMTSCTDQEQKSKLEEQERELKYQASKVIEEIASLDSSYQQNKAELHEKTQELVESRQAYSEKTRECQKLESDIKSGISKMEASEDKIARLEADLVLIADQEKLIVSQLAHIDNSKQKLLTIIENSEGEGVFDPRRKQLSLDIPSNDSTQDYRDAYLTALSSLSDVSNHWSSTPRNSAAIDTKELNGISLTSTPVHKASSESSRDSSPSRLNRKNDFNILKSEDISPIGKGSSYGQKLITPPGVSRLSGTLTPSETILELKRLVEQINEQKAVVLECLENDCDKEELNGHMAVLQELRNRYLEIEPLLDTGSRHRWLSFDDDSNLDVDKGDDSTAANDSEFDDSEIQSSITDQDEHIQMLVEQRVALRLQEIFEELKRGQKPLLLLRDQYMRNHRRSMPSGLNNTSGSGSEEEASSPTPNTGIPRSTSLSSGLWPTITQSEGVIPGILDINIPNYFLRGSGTTAHFQYEVCIVTTLERWTVHRRYQRFRDLHNTMRKKYGGKVQIFGSPSDLVVSLTVSNIPFPPKKFFGRRSESLAKERQKLLEGYLWSLIQVCATIPNCPLHQCSPAKVKDALVAFSSFFQNGVSESTNCGPT